MQKRNRWGRAEGGRDKMRTRREDFEDQPGHVDASQECVSVRRSPCALLHSTLAPVPAALSPSETHLAQVPWHLAMEPSLRRQGHQRQDRSVH